MIDDSNWQPGGTVKRRRFLTGSIYALASLILGAISSSAGAYLLAKPTEEDRNQWTDAGDLPKLRPDSPEEITFARSRVDGWEVRNEKSTAWIVRNSDETLTAFSPLCTHLGCAYQWAAQQRRFSCPCHGSTFDLSGDVISGPAARPLDRYLVKMEGSRLWLGPVERAQSS
jgi:menaquinol-cytochrome c reductase iron-sulfur subunit